MPKNTCHVCGSTPCFLICPMADPFQGDQRAEHDDHESGARYDDIRERFAGEAGVDGDEAAHQEGWR